jgi:hypothetical protein
LRSWHASAAQHLTSSLVKAEEGPLSATKSPSTPRKHTMAKVKDPSMLDIVNMQEELFRRFLLPTIEKPLQAEYLQHEFLDRISIVGALFDNTISNHQLFSHDTVTMNKEQKALMKELRTELDKAATSLAKAYQLMGTVHCGS